jgi:hypothetical protein
MKQRSPRAASPMKYDDLTFLDLKIQVGEYGLIVALDARQITDFE